MRPAQSIPNVASATGESPLNKLPSKLRKAKYRISAVGRARRWQDLPLPLPPGVTEEQMRALIASIIIDGAPTSALDGYSHEAFGRFLRTLDLARGLTGSTLELGANPYFLTVLLKRFTTLDLTLANFFGEASAELLTQQVRFSDIDAAAPQALALESHLFDAEADVFPFPDDTFDLAFFCEIVEHMTDDPLATLRQINRVLKPDGHLILTTPNMVRLENVARVMLGENVYDPYSAHGPHGRHNREYTCRELAMLVRYAGFEVETMFTADSHVGSKNLAAVVARAGGISHSRALELGQYIFVRARRIGPGRPLRPSFLYRSYPAGAVEESAD